VLIRTGVVHNHESYKITVAKTINIGYLPTVLNCHIIKKMYSKDITILILLATMVSCDSMVAACFSTIYYCPYSSLIFCILVC